MKNAKKILEKIVNKPGIYKFFNEKDELIYIGKATNLKSRVSSYFSKKNKETSPWRMKMREKIRRVETIVCENPIEALILETNLIKSLRPKFNVLMKDDKNLVYIKVSKEDFPRLEIVRKVLKDNSVYFGPKTSRGSAKKILELLRKIFPFRSCENMPKTPCLDYHIKKCIGPCTGKISKEEYGKLIEGVFLFLKGKYSPIMKIIKEEIKTSMQKMQFEKCNRLKKQYLEVKKFNEKQRVSDPNFLECDAIGFFEEMETCFINFLKVREGKIIDSENFIMKSHSGDASLREKLSMFVQNFYSEALEIPALILLPRDIDNMDVLETWLTQKKGKKAKLEISSRGQKDGILNFAHENAKEHARKNRISFLTSKRELESAHKKLAKALEIESAEKLECFDISHLSGEHTVASSVVFADGKPEKSLYRRYKIKTLENNKIDDFASMEEVLERRYSKQVYFEKRRDSFLGFQGKDLVFSVLVREIEEECKESEKKKGDAAKAAKKFWVLKNFEFSDDKILCAAITEIQNYTESEGIKLYLGV